MPILESHRRVGYWGLIVAMKSVLKLARQLFDKKSMSYLLTYKLSQDHIETFFSCMRKMGGFNNNPTCRQFKSNYRKLVTHVNSIVPDSANCILQDGTTILRSQISKNNNDDEDETSCELQVLSNVQFDHDYVGSSGWSRTEYSHDIVIYIAGVIVRSIKKQLKCEMCLEQIENDHLLSSTLIKLKNRVPATKEREVDNRKQGRGLTSPSNDVVTICKTAEKVIRLTPNLRSKNILQKLIIKAKMLLSTVNIFPRMDMFVEQTVERNHKLNLINLILKKYFNLQLHHEATCVQDSVQRIRSYYNRIVVFKNQ
ncbi:uncharacterized protein LOC143207960 [Lasioglossum baleicum]|uniref:uncharacterized protein LOC143207960 n=1 Tax=Lasioglossum baleicum TaxID=434251 RepID=UPI003FCE5ED8